MLAKKDHTCVGDASFKGDFHDIARCFTACRGVASMFSFSGDCSGIYKSTTCECRCHTSAARSGICEMKKKISSSLFRYTEACKFGL